MKLIILTFLLSFSLISFSQERKIIKKKSDFYIEIYSIDKGSKKKDGEYVKIKKSTNDTLIFGNYNNDIKVGLWKFNSSSNRIYFYYNYDKRLFNQLPTSISSIDSFYIKKDTAFCLTKVDSPPIYLGYKDEIKDVFRQNAIVPADICEKGLSGNSLASFVVDITGKIVDIGIDNSISKGLDKNIIKTINMINGDWIPAKVNGEPIDSKIYILYNISQITITTKYVEEPYLYVIDLVYYGVIKTTRNY
jgi:hypothetical protein